MQKVNWFEKAALIPSLPKVALDLIETFKQDDPDPKRLARDIEADAVLCARVLRLANSPYYSSGREVRTVQEALMVLGFSPVRNIALSTAVSSLGKSGSGMDMAVFAMLSLMTGMCCEALTDVSGLDKGQAFAAGLLRPIGMLLMRGERPAESLAIDAEVSIVDPRRGEAERKVFGVDHGELSGALARRWKLPEFIVEALSGEGRAGASVKLAQWAASRAMSGVEGGKAFDAYAPAVEWSYALGMEQSPGAAEWPTVEDAKARFGSLAS